MTVGTPKNVSVEQALARVLNEMEDAILLLDRDWRIAYANQAARRISRIEPEHINRETLWELYPDILGTPMEQAYREVVATGEVRRLDAYYYERFQLWFDILMTPMDGGVAVHYRDVTAIRQAEQARDALSEQLEGVLEATTDAVVTLDRGWHMTYLNRRAREVLEPRGEVLGTILWESFPHTVYEGSPYVETYYRAMDERIAGEFEAYYPEPLNLWLHVMARPTEEGIAVFFRDITERRQKEDALRESEERLSAIYSSTFEYIGLINPDGRVIDCNRASLEFAGNTREELVGTLVWECPWFKYTPGAAERLQGAIKRAAAGEFIRYDAALVRPNGEVITFDFSLHPVFDAYGKVVLIVPEGRDITEQKRAEGALMQSEKLAIVGRLASSIAHEINNPLEAVTNLLYLAREHPGVTDEAKRYLDTADQELRRVSIIANQTLRFHKQSSRAQAISCSELFSSVLTIFEGKLKNACVHVEQQTREASPFVCFDGEIRQVLSNLVGNSIDAMPSGGRLLMRSRDATDWRTGRRGLVLSVADTGMGVAPEAKSRVFEPFFTTKGDAGTGLGLWVSSDIVKRHEGHIRLRSAQNQGTVISIFLPFTAESE